MESGDEHDTVKAPSCLTCAQCSDTSWMSFESRNVWTASSGRCKTKTLETDEALDLLFRHILIIYYYKYIALCHTERKNYSTQCN